MSKDLNYVAALERAISQKYGEQTVINPKSGWNEEKEKEYLQHTKEKMQMEVIAAQSSDYLDLDGVFIPRVLINSAKSRKCEYCNTYSFNRDDDVYFSKYETCRKCYIKHIEDREDRWKSGWRPNKMEQK